MLNAKQPAHSNERGELFYYMGLTQARRLRVRFRQTERRGEGSGNGRKRSKWQEAIDT